jgi:hypothetical protein
MPALVAIRFNPPLKAKYGALRKAGKAAIVAIMRKLIVIANALLRDQPHVDTTTDRRISTPRSAPAPLAVFWFGRGSRFPIPATCFTGTARSGCQGWPKATAKRREAALTQRARFHPVHSREASDIVKIGLIKTNTLTIETGCLCLPLTGMPRLRPSPTRSNLG